MNNCEFRRNLWLEFTPVRLVISPVIMIAVTVLVSLTQETTQQFFEALLMTSGVLAGFILMLWAIKLASECVTSEVNERTWVFQRMSSISAFEMTIGKLFGSTAYAWYSAGCCLVAYVVSACNLPDSLLRIKFGIVLVLAALAGQSFSMLMSLVMVKNARFTGKTTKNSVFIVGVGIGLCIISLSPSLFSRYATGITWYALSVNTVDFFLWSAAYAVFWAVTGLYRTMRAELQYDSTPLYWCIFMLTLLVYFNGVALGSSGVTGVLQGSPVMWVSFTVLVFLSYFTLMTESFDPVAIRKIVDRVRKKNWMDAAYITPLWVPTIACTLVLGVAMVMRELVTAPTYFLPYTNPYMREPLSYLPVMVLLLLTRDLGVIGLVKRSGKQKGDFYIAIYFALVYGLVPTIFLLMGNVSALHFFWPVVAGNVVWQVAPLMMEAAGVMYLVWKRREKIFGITQKRIIEVNK